MKFKLDENLPAELLDDLRKAGHEADSVPGEGLTGAPDSVILQHVRAEGRALMTLDKGIGDIRAYPPQEYAGIVLFRPGSSGRATTLEFIRRRLPKVLESDLSGRLLVVTETAIRQR